MTNINVKIDSDIERRATKIFALLGLDLTTGIDMYLRQVVMTQGLPFQPKIVEDYEEDDDEEEYEELGRQLLEVIKKRNIPIIDLPVDENGHAFIDKEKYPDLYDRWVND